MLHTSYKNWIINLKLKAPWIGKPIRFNKTRRICGTLVLRIHIRFYSSYYPNRTLFNCSFVAIQCIFSCSFLMHVAMLINKSIPRCCNSVFYFKENAHTMIHSWPPNAIGNEAKYIIMIQTTTFFTRSSTNMTHISRGQKISREWRLRLRKSIVIINTVVTQNRFLYMLL